MSSSVVPSSLLCPLTTSSYGTLELGVVRNQTPLPSLRSHSDFDHSSLIPPSTRRMLPIIVSFRSSQFCNGQQTKYSPYLSLAINFRGPLISSCTFWKLHVQRIPNPPHLPDAGMALPRCRRVCIPAEVTICAREVVVATAAETNKHVRHLMPYIRSGRRAPESSGRCFRSLPCAIVTVKEMTVCM